MQQVLRAGSNDPCGSDVIATVDLLLLLEALEGVVVVAMPLLVAVD